MVIVVSVDLIMMMKLSELFELPCFKDVVQG